VNAQMKRLRLVNDFVIERGIPTPKSRAPHKTKYPFHSMEVGESFIVPPTKSDNCRSASNQFVRRKQPTWKFSVAQSIGERAKPPYVNVYRCWRVE
jgi:hypothetical protein